MSYHPLSCVLLKAPQAVAGLEKHLLLCFKSTREVFCVASCCCFYGHFFLSCGKDDCDWENVLRDVHLLGNEGRKALQENTIT